MYKYVYITERPYFQPVKNQESSGFRLCRHMCHHRLSQWQPVVPQVTTKTASRQLLVFNGFAATTQSMSQITGLCLRCIVCAMIIVLMDLCGSLSWYSSVLLHWHIGNPTDPQRCTTKHEPCTEMKWELSFWRNIRHQLHQKYLLGCTINKLVGTLRK